MQSRTSVIEISCSRGVTWLDLWSPDIYWSTLAIRIFIYEIVFMLLNSCSWSKNCGCRIFQKIIIFSTFFTTIAFFVTTNCPLCRQGGFSCILGGGAVLGQQSRAAKSIPTVNNLLTWLQNDVIFICLRQRWIFPRTLPYHFFVLWSTSSQTDVCAGCPKKSFTID